MELSNNTRGGNGNQHTAPIETYHNTSTTPVQTQSTDSPAPLQAQDIYCSPARSLCLDIQAMTHYPLAEIAKLCDIPLSTFYRLAMGTTRNPLYKTFDKLLRTYFIVLLNQAEPSTELH